MMFEVDPDGDLIITVQPTAEPFAPWPPATSSETGDNPEAQTNPPVPSDFLVSSKHICLASPRFRKMLTGDWLEANTVYPDGRRHVSMEGFDLTAFRTVMDIIHGKTDKARVPRDITLDMLGKISVLVDDLECHDNVDIFAEVWIDKLKVLKPPTTKTYDRQLIIWIFVSSVFRQATIFQQVTRTAIMKSEGSIPTLGLPIREKITVTIQREREDKMGQIMASIFELFETLRQGKLDNLKCKSKACQSMLIGSLVIGMPSLSMLDGPPEAPFSGQSLANIVNTARKIETAEWFETYNDYDDSGVFGYRLGRAGHQCKIQDMICPKIDEVVQDIKGLDIDRVLPLDMKLFGH